MFCKFLWLVNEEVMENLLGYVVSFDKVFFTCLKSRHSPIVDIQARGRAVQPCAPRCMNLNEVWRERERERERGLF